MIKAVAYCRVSGASQLSGDGFPRQIETIHSSAAALGYELIKEYREEAICGELDEKDRPAFKLMVEELLSNGCRTVFVERLDRLARAYRTQESLLIYLASKEIFVISADTQENVTESILGDPMKKALVQMQGVFAELDRSMLVAKLRKARQRKRAEGIRVEGRKPYGFHPDRPEEKGTLALMVSLSKDQNAQQIAEELNGRGIKPRSGKKWHTNSVRRILARSA